MEPAAPNFNVDEALARLETGASQQRLSADAVQNIRRWLTEPRYAAYAPKVAAHLAGGKWKELDDAFWTVIPFGTGGRRGRMYEIGTNAINDRTIGESAQGLADYVRQMHERGELSGELSCAIAYDTRHRSRHFAELCAGVMAAAGFKVYFLDDYRSTPELSFLVRVKHCSCGIMVTASHNPPSDNAVKVYWSTGGQLLPPHDKAVIDRVMNVQEIARMEFQEALSQGRVLICTKEIDAAYLAALRQQGRAGPRDLQIIYSPLHGVGASSVAPALAADGFQHVEVYEPHAEPSGDFPNVPGHVSNPENPRVFDAIIEHARRVGAELILVTDPDCDRMGCAAPLTLDASGPWATLDGNQLAGLLADYVLDRRKQEGGLSPEHYIVTTLVTTGLIRRIGDAFGVKTRDDLLVGFKYIGGVMEELGAEKFVFGAEESHGYLVGSYARDKDGAVACMLMAELAAHVKAARQSLHEWLDALYWRFGLHAERLINVQMEGAQGMANMQALMQRFREAPPTTIGGLKVASVRDYSRGVVQTAGGPSQPLEGPRGDLVILDFAEEGNSIAVRPSGTEPKIKFYMFAYTPAELLADLDAAKQDLKARLDRVADDLRKLAQE